MSPVASRLTSLRSVAACMAAAVAMAWLPGAARAELVDLQWQAGGRFQRSMTVAPGQFVELCGALTVGQTIRWSFNADRPLNFNIHFHVDKDVKYPAKHDQVARLEGRLPVASAQDYCWMWVNKSPGAAMLAVRLSRG